MNRKQKRSLYRILLSAVLLAAAVCTAHFMALPWWGELLVFLVPYLVIGAGTLKRAAVNIAHGQIFDENFLMTIATIGALCIGEYPEAVFVMLFYQVGELFENIAVGRSRKSIAGLMDIRPDYANVERNGEVEQVDPADVRIGETIVIKPGERVPLDGIVLEGASSLNTTALTGESLPRNVAQGESVISGCVNLNGLLRVSVTHEYGESTVAKILELVENSAANKARTENFITRFARIYTPAVVGGAVLLAIVPPLFAGEWSVWLYRALTFLVTSCPCALVISVPLSFFGGIGGASKRGILIKGSNYLEALADSEIVVFDKTGTLTHGTFYVTAIHPNEISESELLEIAALAECYSDHPISVSLKNAYGREPDRSRVSDMTEVAGQGISVLLDGHRVSVGNDKLMDAIGAAWHACHKNGTVIHVAVDGEYAGHIVISDEVKPESAEAIHLLRKNGVRRTVMLTGDRRAVGEEVAQELGLDEVYTQLLPAGKVEKVESLLAEKSPKGKLLFVGDGINDAPVLSRADVGVAMGVLGSDAAIEAADVVLMDDDPRKIALAIQISRRTKQIVLQNIVFALGVKLLVLILVAFGLANMWAAVFADVGVSVIAILNAVRTLKTSDRKKL